MKRITQLLMLFFILFSVKTRSQCTNTNALGCKCAAQGTTNCDLLPDIIPAKALLLDTGIYGVLEYAYNDPTTNKSTLRISVSTPNIGHGPLEIQSDSTFICGTDTFTGIPPATCVNTGLPPKILIRQYIYHKNGATMTYIKKPAGSMTYHPAHGHMHVDEWGHYSLRIATTDPNPLNWPIVGTGSKLAFCLMDFGTCNTFLGHCVDSTGNVLGNSNFPNLGLGGGNYVCSNLIQGISSGYTDIYYQYLSGMYIQLDSTICNGTYWIVVQLDPLNYFTEENENNNVVAVPYTLTKQRPEVVVGVTGNQTLCNTSSVNLSATGATSYAWSPSTGLNTTAGSTVVASPSTTTSYTVIGTKPGVGCTDTNYVTVNVNSSAVINVSGNTSVCANSSTVLTASGAVSYTWAPSTGLSATNTATVTASPAATTTYTVTGTTQTGCTGTTTVQVTVNGTFTITTSGNVAVCQGVTAALTASGGVSYTWSPSVALSATTGSSVNATPNTTTTYTVTGTSANGCTATKTAKVTVNPVPVINFPPLNANYYDTTMTVPLQATPLGGTYFGAGVSGSNFSPYVAGAGGPYYISYSYTNTYGCQAAAATNTTVIYTCAVVTGVTATNITSTSALISWNGSSTGPFFRIRYKLATSTVWSSKKISGIPHRTSYTLTGLTPNTNYKLNMRPLCTNVNTALSATIAFKTAAAISPERLDASSDEVMWIYPNPSKGSFNINFICDIATKGNIKIFDPEGRMLYNKSINIEEGENDLPLQLEKLAKGIYFIELSLNYENYKQKIVIE